MITSKRGLVRSFTMFTLLTILSLFILNTNSYAEPIDISPRAIDCEICRQPAPTYIERIHGDTRKSGQDCKHCNINDHHYTDVYTRTRVTACSKGCTSVFVK
ncbi:hypothetical protein [Tissierella praeacuta]|uniref:hypothetical protein n=1 Tax=Tissierella praeacuta TaxID=43131 RepID=UPI00334127B5